MQDAGCIHECVLPVREAGRPGWKAVAVMFHGHAISAKSVKRPACKSLLYFKVDVNVDVSMLMIQ